MSFFAGALRTLRMPKRSLAQLAGPGLQRTPFPPQGMVAASQSLRGETAVRAWRAVVCLIVIHVWSYPLLPSACPSRSFKRSHPKPYERDDCTLRA